MLEQSDIPLFLCRWLCLKVGLKSRQSIDYSAFSSTSFSFRIFSATALARDNFSRKGLILAEAALASALKSSLFYGGYGCILTGVPFPTLKFAPAFLQ